VKEREKFIFKKKKKEIEGEKEKKPEKNSRYQLYLSYIRFGTLL